VNAGNKADYSSACRHLSVRQSALLLTVFTHPGYRPRLIIPVSAHIIADVYSASRLALPHTLLQNKKPRVFRSRGFWKFGC
jgi:hypothetical protein